MKKIRLAFLALVATSIITVSSVYASFPVKNEVKTEQTVSSNSTTTTQNANYSNVEKASHKKISAKPENKQDNDKLITILLWLFLGWLAAHRWYAGKPAGWNILFILTAGGCGVWAIIDLVNILTDNF